jgi:hypothetical protein
MSNGIIEGAIDEMIDVVSRHRVDVQKEFQPQAAGGIWA